MAELYQVQVSAATKVVVTISRRQLWNNFVEAWRDIAWDDPKTVSTINEVASVLLADDDVSLLYLQIRKLFRDGWTVMLLGEAMGHFDNPALGNNVLRELVVQDVSHDGTVGPLVVVRHEDIVF